MEHEIDEFLIGILKSVVGEWCCNGMMYCGVVVKAKVVGVCSVVCSGGSRV